VGALWARRTLVPVPQLASPFIWRCGGALPQTAGAPDQGASRIEKPIRRSLRRDHFPNIYMSLYRLYGRKLVIHLPVPCQCVTGWEQKKRSCGTRKLSCGDQNHANLMHVGLLLLASRETGREWTGCNKHRFVFHQPSTVFVEYFFYEIENIIIIFSEISIP
jgi:hypothetical protein